MKQVNLVFQYVSYKLFAQHAHGHGIHSPFVFDFIINVLDNDYTNEEILQIERQRRKLLINNEIINITDFGAGSKKERSDIRKICDVVRFASVKPKFGRLFYRLVKHYKLPYIVELGTSAGIGAMYFSKGNPAAQIITVEGDKKLTEISKKVFSENHISNILLINDLFENAIPEILNLIENDFIAFIDGDHRKEKLLLYFELLLKKATPQTIIIIDDIRWSAGMNEAWNIIISDRRVKISIDLFFMGIVFFKKNIEKQHFVFKF